MTSVINIVQCDMLYYSGNYLVPTAALTQQLIRLLLLLLQLLNGKMKLVATGGGVGAVLRLHAS